MADTGSPPASKARAKAGASYSTAKAQVAAAGKTIFVLQPTAGNQTCPTPFQVLGVKGDNTVINSCTIIVPGNPDMVGTPIPEGDLTSPINFGFSFDSEPPCGVPLSVVIHGTVTDPETGDTRPEDATVPFECVCQD